MGLDAADIFAIGLVYVLALFGIAYSTNRGWIPHRLVRHPLVYVMSLGVFASALAFYGVVGLAHEYGYNFLNYYLGIAGFFLLGPLLLMPLQRICRTNQLASLADLLTFRYRSQWAGALVSIFLTVSILPIMALQIKAVTDTVQILTSTDSQLAGSTLPQPGVALAFCAIIALFTMLYGAGEATPGRRQNGLVLAIAFETLVKTLTLIAIGCASLFGIFGGLEGLERWLGANPEVLQKLNKQGSDDMGRVLMLISFAAAIGMPHMFHMALSVNPSRESLRASVWGLPLLMLIISLPVLPILWGAMAQGAELAPEYFTLGIGISLDSPLLCAITFIGGLSAASGIIIVSTLALASMCLNHLILPFYQPDTSTDIYRWIVWVKRSLIAAIMLAGLVFYLTFRYQGNLSALGISGFSAALQFLPGTVALLYAPGVNRKGFVAGLASGMLAWLLTLFLPALSTIEPTLITAVSGFGQPGDNWPSLILFCFSLNIIVMVLVSATTGTSDDEKAAAELCSVDKLARPQRQSLAFGSVQAIRQALATALGKNVAQREVDRAMQALQLEESESRPYALRRLRNQIEANLSGLFGATVANHTVNRLLPYNADTGLITTEDIHLVETRLELEQQQLTGLAAGLDGLRRFYRQTLLDLPMGACILGQDHEIVLWNSALEKLSGIPADYVTGALADNMPPPWGYLLLDFAARKENRQLKRELVIENARRLVNLQKTHSGLNPGHSGDTIILVEDVTEAQLLEDELIHSERLASLGRVAAGVAHEIGNPVTGIACLAQNLRAESEDPELQEIADDILTQTARISAIVQTLVNFSHGGKHTEIHSRDNICLYDCVNEAINLLLLDKESQPVRYLNNCDGQYLVVGNQQRLTQVFLNLLSNARDACIPNQQIVVDSWLLNASMVAVAVTDPGSGIDPVQQEHIWEPFFTTKEPGQGTGLGLAVVYSIVEAHGGKIRVESPLAVGTRTGTRVTIELPRGEPGDSADWSI